MNSRSAYKETKIGQIPSEWEFASLGDNIATIVQGKTPKRNQYHSTDTGYKIIKFRDITNSGLIQWNNEESGFVENDAEVSKSLRELQVDDVLLTATAHSSDQIGKKLAIVKALPSKYIRIFFVGELIALRALDKTMASWLFYWFSSKRGYESIQNEVREKHLIVSKATNIKLPIPPIAEQKKITSMLSTVDQSIQKCDEMVAKTQLLKKGLTRQLFSRGIKHTRFKQTGVGEIPEEWEAGPIRSYIESMKSGLSRRITSEDIGLPVLTSTNVKDSQLDIGELKYWYRDDPQGADTSNYILQPGDLLLNFINSIHQIGKCCVFEDIGRDAIYTTNLFRIVVNQEKTSSKFLNYLINHNLVQKQVKRITKPAINQASFTKPDFESIEVPLVSFEEQQEIASVLSTIDEKTGRERQEKEALTRLKKGLMDDLLTGKVRVKVT